MQVNKVFKLQLEADKNAWLTVDSQSRVCNWLYNHLLEKANFFKQQFIDTGNAECSKIVYTKYGLRDLIPNLKKEHPFLKTVHSSPLKNSALRLTQTIQAYQKGKKGKRKNSTGWPSFQAWKANWFSLYYDEPNKGFKIIDNALKLSFGADKNGKKLSVLLQIKDAYLLKGQTQGVFTKKI